MICLLNKARLDILHGLAAGFRNGIGEAIALEGQIEEIRLLQIRALQADIFEQAVMVLRDLPERGIGGGNNRDHFGQRGVRHLRPAVLGGHGNTPQAAVGEHIQHLGGHLAQLVTFGIALQ